MILGVVASSLAQNVGDEYWDNVVSLLHFDQNPTPFYDERGATWVATGNVAISAAQSAFGGRSAVFDGSGDHLTATPTDANLNSSIYTIEGWGYLNATNYNPSSAQNGRCIFTTYEAQGVGRIVLNMATDGSLQFNEQSPNGTTNHQASSAAAAVPQQQWFHWAITRDNTSSSGVIRLFINGILIASATGVAARADYAARLRLGTLDPASGTFSNWWLGYIDEFRVTRGVARYTANFTPPSRAFIGGNIDKFYDDVKAHLRFSGIDAATVAAELSAQRLAIFAGNAQIDTAVSRFGGSSLLLDGTGDYVDLGDSADFNLQGAFTAEGWVRLSSTLASGANSRYVMSKTAAPFTSGFVMGIRRNVANTATVFFAQIGNGADTRIDGTTALAANTWYHVAQVYDGTTLRLFVDGVQENSLVTAAAVNNSSPLRIGDYSGGDRGWAGWIDDARLSIDRARYSGGFAVPIGPHPIGTYDKHYGNVVFMSGFPGADGSTNTIDESRFQRTVSFVGNAHVETTGAIQGATSIDLDGTGDEVTIADAAELEFGSNDFTIETSFVLDAAPNSTGTWIISKYQETSNLRSWAIFVTNTTIEVRASSNGTTSGTAFHAQSHAFVFSTGVRYDIAWVRRGDTSYVFVNGILLGQQAFPVAGFIVFNSSPVVRMGAAGAGSSLNFLDGRIDEVRLTNGVGRYISNYTPRFPFARMKF